ncbi:MAG: CRISPR-associated endonuclease Cas1, partial [Planctomycetota bacterium]
MKRNYYLFSNGRISRKDNTIFFIRQEEPQKQSMATLSQVDSALVDSNSLQPSSSNASKKKASTFQREKIPLPIQDIESIYIFGEVDFNVKAINFLAQNQIPLHLFNYYGYYSGTFYPREYLNSGKLLVQQVQHYTKKRKRLELAKEFVRAASTNILKNLQ